MRGRGRKERDTIQLIVDVPRADKGDTAPLQVCVVGCYVYKHDGEYCIFMKSPFFSGTHTDHSPMTGKSNEDAETIANSLADMIDDMRKARR